MVDKMVITVLSKECRSYATLLSKEQEFLKKHLQLDEENHGDPWCIELNSINIK